MIVRNLFLGAVGMAVYLCGTYFNLITPSYLITSDNNDPTEIRPRTEDNENTIQVALLLDTSSSMSGLIEQAKSQLWNILNQLSRTAKNGEETSLEVALYEYGNPGKATQKFQINQLTAFTTDMDLVSEKLFSLNTGGGDEYCGAIIKKSFDDLRWIEGEGLKIIYIAGNEGFDQGPINFTKACYEAIESGITVNTIYCGDEQGGINAKWKAGAIAGGGDYLFIEHNKATVYVPTPYDQKIQQLNTELNKTYIPFGEKGKAKKENQARQDSNAGSYSLSNAGDRAAFKSSKKYKATDWDLVDAYKNDKEILNTADIVTDSLQNLSIAELEEKVQEISERRVSIQIEIQELDKKRRAYKAENSANVEEASLQGSMIGNINKLAKEKGFEVKE